MSASVDKTALLREVLAPWDEMAWENFREAHPEAAEQLMELVGAGGTQEEIRKFCEDEGYSRRVADWLAHAAEHLRRGLVNAGARPALAGNVPSYTVGVDSAVLKRAG